MRDFLRRRLDGPGAGRRGRLNAVIGILSDAHGNRPAFDRAIEVLTREGARGFVFLGDAVGYIPTRAVVTSIRALGGAITCVRGNHDETMLSRASDKSRIAVRRSEAIGRSTGKTLLSRPGSWVM